MNRIAASFVALTVYASGALAADQPKNDVRVVNTPAESVPVAVQGTASVAGTVEVTNVPTVRFDTNQVVPVRLLETAPSETFFVEAGLGAAGSRRLLTVPEGRIAVIEHVSARVSSPVGTVPEVQITTLVADSAGSVSYPGIHFLQLHYGGTQNYFSSEAWVYLASHPMKLSVPPGGSIYAVYLGAQAPQAAAHVRVTGHYTPAP
jgi:hypothetical protein